MSIFSKIISVLSFGFFCKEKPCVKCKIENCTVSNPAPSTGIQIDSAGKMTAQAAPRITVR